MNKIPVRVLLQRTYALCRLGFWGHFMTAWPPSLVAILVYVAGNALVRNIFRAEPRPWIASVEATPVRLMEFLLAWLVTAFAFGAVSSRLLPSSVENQPRIADPYTLARGRLRPILAVGLISFGLLLVGWFISFFCMVAVNKTALIPSAYRAVALQAVLWVCLTTWLTLMCRLALSIPCIMDKPQVTAWNAIKISCGLSEDYERFFLVLVAQTIALTLLFNFLEKTFLSLLWERNTTYWEIYPLVANGLYSVVAAVLDTGVFVGFTVLYLEVKDAPKEAAQEEAFAEGVSAAPISPR